MSAPNDQPERMEPKDDLTVAYMCGYEAGKDAMKARVREAVDAVRAEIRQSAWIGHEPPSTAADAYDAGGLASLDALLARLGLNP